MGIRSFFGFSSSGTETMGRAGTEEQERARRDRFEQTGHASSGYTFSEPEIVTGPPKRRRNSHRD